jgi:hypothetical protein
MRARSGLFRYSSAVSPPHSIAASARSANRSANSDIQSSSDVFKGATPINVLSPHGHRQGRATTTQVVDPRQPRRNDEFVGLTFFASNGQRPSLHPAHQSTGARRSAMRCPEQELDFKGLRRATAFFCAHSFDGLNRQGRVACQGHGYYASGCRSGAPSSATSRSNPRRGRRGPTCSRADRLLALSASMR